MTSSIDSSLQSEEEIKTNLLTNTVQDGRSVCALAVWQPAGISAAAAARIAAELMMHTWELMEVTVSLLPH